MVKDMVENLATYTKETPAGLVSAHGEIAHVLMTPQNFILFIDRLERGEVRRFSANIAGGETACLDNDDWIDEEWGTDAFEAPRKRKVMQLAHSTFHSWRSSASFLSKLQFLVMTGGSPPELLKDNQLVVSKTDAIRALTMATRHELRK